MTQPLNVKDTGTLRAYAQRSADGVLDAADADALVGAAQHSKTRAEDLGLILAAEKAKALTPEAARKIEHALGQGPAVKNPLAALDVTTARAAPAQPKPKKGLSARAPGTAALPAPPRHELRAISREELERGRRLAEHRATQERLQRAMNQHAMVDPFAARVNGMMQDPSGNWFKAGPNPLEVASSAVLGGTVPGQLYGAYKAGEAIHAAVEDPSAGNIAKATLKTGLVVGGAVHTAHLSHAPIIEVGVPMTEGLVLPESHRPGSLLHKKKGK